MRLVIGLAAAVWATSIIMAAQPMVIAAAQPTELFARQQTTDLMQSVHRTLSCRACHGEMEMVFGRRPDPVATCTRCHVAAAEALRRDGHWMARAAGNAQAPTCVSCHGSHAVRSRTDPDSPSFSANVPAQCGACHEPSLTEFRPSVHALRTHPGEIGPAATCTNCHTAHAVAPAMAPWSTVARSQLAGTCAACHLEAGRAYNGSVHAIAVGRGAADAPTCVDCHSSHGIQPAAAPHSPTSVLHVAAQTCGHCHGDVRLTETYRLPASVVTDVEGSFHGLAGAIGDRRVANCASCHGYHEVRPSWDPQSRIHPANLVTTCGACHQGAAPGFARGGVHHLPRTFGHRLVDLARAMYRMMIIGIIGLMLLHNGLDFTRRWRDRRAQRARLPMAHAGASSFARFTLNERVQHWVLAGSFITLAVSGFALPQGWRVPWVDGQTGATIRAAVHRVAAVVFIVLAIYHVGYIAFTTRGRTTLRAILPRFDRAGNVVCSICSCMRCGPPSTADWRDLVQTVRYNLGRATVRPRFGRFSYPEKMEYLALVWGGAVMIGTGLALWFEVPFLNRFPFWGFELATVVHFYEAVLASLAIVVWHFYFTIVNPDVFPISKVMLTGQITREEMEREHPLELEECEREPSS
jgi:cytochrome b subunit of formate dehydrogenase